MTLLRLERFRDDGKRTIGRLYVNGVFFCHTLEDTFRPVKVKGETRIWAGTYEMTPRLEGGFYTKYAIGTPEKPARFRPWHKGMIWIRDVDGDPIDPSDDFEFILIHPGNTEKNTEGCVLVGTWNYPDKWITTSVKAYKRLYEAIYDLVEAGGAQIEIVDLDR